MAPRWKGKASKAKALEQPMSHTISELQSTLIRSKSKGLLSGCSVLLEVDSQHAQLLYLTCFGRSIPTSQTDKQWFQLGFEEAFFLHHSLKCLEIVTSDGCAKNEQEIWHYMCSKLQGFPDLYKAYSHLRTKNWVVRPGSQYGVDYVAYRHHPALVHSEYAVLVLSDDTGAGGANGRLTVWSDFHCTLRLCGSVAKTLLVIKIHRKTSCGSDFPACLDKFSVVERTVSRWNPEQSREEKSDTRCDKHEEKSDAKCVKPEEKSDAKCVKPEEKSDAKCDKHEEKSDAKCDNHTQSETSDCALCSQRLSVEFLEKRLSF